jgi:hypothetical protein
MKKGVSLYAFLTMALEVSGQLHVPAILLCVRTTQAVGGTRKQCERCGKQKSLATVGKRSSAPRSLRP